MTGEVPYLPGYDIIVVSSSGGKDSQTALDVVASLAMSEGVLDRVVLLHCDLGRVEWPGSKELALAQAGHYGIRTLVVSRKQNDLLDHVAAHGKWPGPTTRYCTSDHKRGPSLTAFTQLVGEVRERLRPLSPDPVRQVRLLDVQGLRAQESPRRKKMKPFFVRKDACNGYRHVNTWLPIHSWTTEEVWENIRRSGVPYHPVYDQGMPRLSCSFCIYSPRDALLRAGQLNRPLLDQYVAVERLIQHRFRKDLSLEEVRDALDRGEGPSAHLESWEM